MDLTTQLINGLDRRLQQPAWAFIGTLRSIGIPVRVISGRRSPQANQAVGGAPASYHLDGLAFDIQLGDLRRDQVPLWVWHAIGQVAEKFFGLYWGGRFTHNGAPDVNHFDARRLIEEGNDWPSDLYQDDAN